MKAAADLTLKAGAIALIAMLGCVVGRISFLLMTATDLTYWPSAAGIEFLFVAPFGAIPAALVALVFMGKERSRTVRHLRRIARSPELKADEFLSIESVLSLLKERQP